MFPLSRPHRQVLATLAIGLVAVLPSLYVAAIAWRIGRPGHLREAEVEIGRRLGLQVGLQGVRYPRPGEVIYTGVVVRQEEPRRKGFIEIARARTVHLRAVERELIVATEGLRLRGESPKLAIAQVGTLLQRPLATAFDRLSFNVPDCRLDLGDESLRYDLRDLAGVFQADRATATVRASYRMVAKGASTRCELTLTRDRGADPVRTTLAIKTMDGLPLPANVLNVFIDADDWLGKDARIEGSLTLRQSGAREWEAEFQGDLHDVDLATLVGRRFPSHRLAGRARVAIRSARWGDRPSQGFGWIETRGELTTRHGSINVGLLQALVREMRFRLPGQIAVIESSATDIEFHELGLSFEMRPDGEILLGGALGNDYAPDVVLASQRTPVAYSPRGAANVRGLIKTLVPTDASDPVMVPLTDESRILMCFPSPPRLVAKRIDGN